MCCIKILQMSEMNQSIKEMSEMTEMTDLNKLICDAIDRFNSLYLLYYDETQLQRFKNYVMNTEESDIDTLCDEQFYIKQMNLFEEEEKEEDEEDEEDEDYDERRNSFEAFNEWFNKEVRSLEDIERNDEDWNEVVREWCNNNNHEIREDGIYNMNIKVV